MAATGDINAGYPPQFWDTCGWYFLPFVCGGFDGDVDMVCVKGEKMDEAKYDKRIVDPNCPPEGYESYIKSLRCCVCGERKLCDCTPADYISNKR